MISSDCTVTTTELLDGLHDPSNHMAWQEFDRRYRPVLLFVLRRMGLDASDAADVAQETVACFVRDYRQGRYNREQGRLRTWLIGIAKCRYADHRRRRVRRRELRGDSALRLIPDDEEAEAIWETEQRRVIFEQAVGELKRTARFTERTLGAFERIALRNEPVEVVSRETGLTPQEIYNAKNRVVGRLREIVKRYEVSMLGD